MNINKVSLFCLVGFSQNIWLQMIKVLQNVAKCIPSLLCFGLLRNKVLMLVPSFKYFFPLTQQCEGLSGLYKIFSIVYSLDEDVLTKRCVDEIFCRC